MHELIQEKAATLASRPVPATGSELSRFALEMEAHVKDDLFCGKLPGWLSKTHCEEGQAFVIDEGEFHGWVLAVLDGEVLGVNPHHWCRCLAGTEEELCDMDTEEVAHRLDRAFEFASCIKHDGVHDLLDLTVLPMELPEGFDRDEAEEKGVVMCHADGSCVVDTYYGFRATTLAELGLKAHDFADLTFEELVEAAENDDQAALERLKRDYPPTGLDTLVVDYYEIVAFDPTTRRVLVEDEDGKVGLEYDNLVTCFYDHIVDPWDGAEILARDIERFVENGGTFQGKWGGLDITPTEGGWRIVLLVDPDEGAVIEVVDGKATVVGLIEVDPPTGEEFEQIRLSLTRPHDGGIPI